MIREMKLRELLAGMFVVAIGLLMMVPVPAGATWPGTNGKIYFVCREAGVGFNGQDICSIEPDGSGLVNLTETPADSESLPEVSKDGSQVSFTRGSGDTFIWVMNADGTNQRQVTTVPSDGTSWTPDGKIAFRGEMSTDFYEFRTVPPSGGATTRLGFALGSYSPPKFTSDGRWLYTKFAPVSPGAVDWTSQVFVVDGTEETQATASDPSLSSNSFPSWSPDGSSILYNRNDSAPGFGPDDDIYMVPSAGGAEVQLTDTNGPVDERWASISPDGSKLIYQGEDATHDFFAQFLSISNADGSNPVPIATPTLDYAAFPVWAPGPVVEPPPPDPIAGFTATAPKTSKASKPVKVTLRCIGDTRCAVSYSAKMAVPRKGKPAKKFSIKAKKLTLESKATKVVQVKVPGAAKGLVKKALKARKKPLLKVTAAATQPEGPKIRTVNLSVKLKK